MFEMNKHKDIDGQQFDIKKIKNFIFCEILIIVTKLEKQMHYIKCNICFEPVNINLSYMLF